MFPMKLFLVFYGLSSALGWGGLAGGNLKSVFQKLVMTGQPTLLTGLTFHKGGSTVPYIPCLFVLLGPLEKVDFSYRKVGYLSFYKIINLSHL